MCNTRAAQRTLPLHLVSSQRQVSHAALSLVLISWFDYEGSTSL